MERFQSARVAGCTPPLSEMAGRCRKTLLFAVTKFQKEYVIFLFLTFLYRTHLCKIGRVPQPIFVLSLLYHAQYT